MISIVILISVLAMVTSAPTEMKSTVIDVDGPEGRHVQIGEPGKAVSGYFTSRSADGAEYRTTYEADERGFRANGLHLPVSPAPFLVRYPTPVYASHIFRYGPQNYLPFSYPTHPQDEKYYQDEDPLSYEKIAYKSADDQLPLSELGQLALAEDDQTAISEEEIAALAERGWLTPLLLPFVLANKKKMLMIMLINKILMATG